MSRIFLMATAAAAVMFTINSASAASPPLTGLYEVTIVTTNTSCFGQPKGTVAAAVFNLGAAGTATEFGYDPVASTSAPEFAHQSYSTAFPNSGGKYVAGTWTGSTTTTLVTPTTGTTIGTTTFKSTVTLHDSDSFFIAYSDATGCTNNQTFIRL